MGVAVNSLTKPTVEISVCRASSSNDMVCCGVRVDRRDVFLVKVVTISAKVLNRDVVNTQLNRGSDIAPPAIACKRPTYVMPGSRDDGAIDRTVFATSMSIFWVSVTQSELEPSWTTSCQIFSVTEYSMGPSNVAGK